MTTATDTPNFGVEDLDPTQMATAVTIVNTPAMTSPGHGYTLPLVGRERPHLLEAVLPDQSLRIFADRPEDVLAAMIDGYAALEEELAQAVNAGEQTKILDCELAGFTARSDHATTVRHTLQEQINAEAQANGTWSSLDEEEREQLTLEQGAVPKGVLYTAPAEDDLGNLVEQEFGLWSSVIPLVLNRGEYVDGDVLEPESDLTTELPDGRQVVVVVEHPANLVRLDPTDPYSYLKSLGRAGVVTLTEREIIQVDPLFEAVMEAVNSENEAQADS